MTRSSAHGTRRASLAILLAIVAAPAWAQTEAPPPARGEVHWGPVTLRPRLEIRDLGFDSNIFNTPTDPQEDFVATITPRLDVLIDLSWAQARYGTFADFVYFHDFEDERTINGGNEGRFELLLDRVRPYFSAAIVDTSDRLNAEVDARAHRRDWRLEGGLRIALSTRAELVGSVRRISLDYDDDEVFNGVMLADTLNNDSDTVEGGVRFELTPLTTLLLTGSYQRGRFDIASTRDAQTWRIGPTFELAPSALISGRLAIGYESFDPKSPAIPPYTGFMTQGALTWSLGSTKLEGRIERGVRYSFEQLHPYYVMTGGRLTVTQVIAGPFEVHALGDRQQFEYRTFEPIDTVAGERRTDTITIWGGGVGFRFGDTAKIGLTYEDAARRSPASVRWFDRQRIYGTLTYGF